MVEPIKINYMKTINKIYLLLATVVLFIGACTKADDLTTATYKEGGLLEVQTPSINLIVGEGGDYNIEYKVFQTPTIYTNKIETYILLSTFKRNADGSLYYDVTVDPETGKEDSTTVAITSNEKLLSTIDVTETTTHFVSFTTNLADMVSGLSVEGNDFYTDLPTDDTQYLIGDTWNLRIVSTTNEGNTHENYSGVAIAVSTRYAGTYTCSDLTYYRLGVLSPSYWLGDDIVIKSVDAITYFYDWGITIGWDGPLYFQIDPEGNITYPEEWNGTAQTLNGEPLITCDRNPTDLTNVPCDGSNIAIKDDVDGKDQLIMTYGYYTGGSGPREFHEVLIKQVN